MENDNNKAIVLSERELEVLKKCASREFNPLTASEEEQDVQITLLDMAEDYEAENDLVDERCDYSYDCNLLVWFFHRYCLQEGLDEGVPKRTPEDGVHAMTDSANE